MKSSFLTRVSPTALRRQGHAVRSLAGPAAALRRAPALALRGLLLAMALVAAPCTASQLENTFVSSPKSWREGSGSSSPADRQAQQAWMSEMERVFARYLAAGRSDKELDIRMVPGVHGSGSPFARSVDPQDGGPLKCTIGGLRLAYRGQVLGFADTAVMRAGVAIHEHTHCQVNHNLLRSLQEERGLEYRALFMDKALPMLDLAVESIADARAVIELGRVDGLDAAREFLTKTTRARNEDAGIASFSQTQAAMALAYQWLERHGAKSIDATEAFEAGLQAGLHGMSRTLETFVRRKHWQAPPYLVARAMELLEAGGRDALREFRQGRYSGHVVALEAGSTRRLLRVEGGAVKRRDLAAPYPAEGAREIDLASALPQAPAQLSLNAAPSPTE